MNLGNRLELICGMIEDCNLIADIGTDHAYIPIKLVSEGRVKSAIATDVVDGPVKIAMDNVKNAGLEQRIRVFKSDGLMSYKDFDIDYYIIAGMGGNTIISILSDFILSNFKVEGHLKFSKFLDSQLILQPMSSQIELRAWLVQNSFEILCEKIALEQHKYYNIIKVRYAPDSKVAKLAKLEFNNVDDFLVSGDFGMNFGINPIVDLNYIAYLKFELIKNTNILKSISNARQLDEERMKLLSKLIRELGEKLSKLSD